ncbi:hypothetical protein RSOL_348590 [Rhizoctonia solani AG-3 Rhs1AP]|uniref:Uncharacterized protein n=2 Tax=Rhizoctonia solani AG-3 TaxID=1086053 RepID=A0A074RNF3_9AGAM|nr:hypothetical protein RSOL_348590 [Rhizoctonia solani AG-3 Rhs1AP]KEP48611.1 hypothetical protein V565_120230 [Rhizoctonia solani 123E]
MRCGVLSFVSLLVIASTVAAQPTKRLVSINPPQNLRINLTALPPVEVTPITNAKRFAQGLPPLSPVKRHPHRRGPHHDGGYPRKGTRVAFIPRAEASPSVPTKHCNILVKPTNGSILGYISPVFNDFGEYGTPQTSQAGALEITFSYTASSGSVYGPADFLTTNNVNATNSFPYLSAALGFMSDGDNLGPGNVNYLVITGNSGSTGSGSTPSNSTGNSYVTRTGQSANSTTAIWTYDPTNQDIRVMWTNSDGGLVPTKLVYVQDTEIADGDGNTLVAAGDLDAFRSSLGCTDTCPEVVSASTFRSTSMTQGCQTFTCVPPA